MANTTGVSIPKSLTEWADENYTRLGYTSRSELIRDAVRRFRDDHQEAIANAPV